MKSTGKDGPEGSGGLAGKRRASHRSFYISSSFKAKKRRRAREPVPSADPCCPGSWPGWAELRNLAMAKGGWSSWVLSSPSCPLPYSVAPAAAAGLAVRGGRRKEARAKTFRLAAVGIGCFMAAALRVTAVSAYDFPAASWVETTRDDSSAFTARMGHAATVFDDKLWVIGGRSDLYQAYNLEYTSRLADVWYSEDYGVNWVKFFTLTGDFWAQNFDAVNPGELAPWYARYGHKVDVLNCVVNGTDTKAMLLTGGFTPNPNNDVWVSLDGSRWDIVQYANWTARAWHATAVLDEGLYIFGGSPLTNDVWVGTDVTYVHGRDGGGWDMEWRQVLEAGESVAWSPRCGMGLTMVPSTLEGNSTMFLTGGFGGWPSDSSRYDGFRSRADVYASQNAVNWTLVTDSPPWEPRAWHSLVTWASVDSPYEDVGGVNGSVGGGSSPRIWLAGGAYKGEDQSTGKIVYDTIGRVDMWYSYDGANWVQVNYQEGEGANQYSSMEWFLTAVDDVPIYIGKWGHEMVAWQRELTEMEGPNAAGTLVPALYVLGGDTVDEGSLSYQVFRSTPELLCSYEGVMCAGVGECTGFKCVCPETASGTFCEIDGASSTSGAARRSLPFTSNRRAVVLPLLLSVAVAVVVSAWTVPLGMWDC